MSGRSDGTPIDPPTPGIPIHVAPEAPRPETPLRPLPGIPFPPKVPAMRSASGTRDLFKSDVAAGKVSPFQAVGRVKSINGTEYKQLANGSLIRTSGKAGRRKAKKFYEALARLEAAGVPIQAVERNGKRGPK